MTKVYVIVSGSMEMAGYVHGVYTEEAVANDVFKRLKTLRSIINLDIEEIELDALPQELIDTDKDSR